MKTIREVLEILERDTKINGRAVTKVERVFVNLRPTGVYGYATIVTEPNALWYIVVESSVLNEDLKIHVIRGSREDSKIKQLKDCGFNDKDIDELMKHMS